MTEYKTVPDDVPSEDATRVPTEEGKVPPETANYQPKGRGSMVCANCANFEPPESCLIVAGQIDPNGLSDLFQPAGGMAALDNSSPMSVL